MKPSSSNRQLLGLVRNTRRAHNLSGTEIGLDASHNNIRLLSERREKNFLDIPSHRTHRTATPILARPGPSSQKRPCRITIQSWHRSARKTLGLYLGCPKRRTEKSPGLAGRAVKIEPFEGSRWRLRRMRSGYGNSIDFRLQQIDG